MRYYVFLSDDVIYKNRIRLIKVSTVFYHTVASNYLYVCSNYTAPGL